MRLGLRPNDHLRIDARTLKLGDLILPDFAYPVSCNLTSGCIPDCDPLGNLEVGDCALAGPAHRTRWLDDMRGTCPTIFTEDVLNEYRNFGYVPGDESTDQGCYALDVMNRWRKEGLFGRAPILAFGEVDFRNREQIAAATFLCGGVFLCLSLPNKVKDGSVFDAQVWDVAGEDGGRAGNHLVWRHGDEVNSWGFDILTSWEFIQRYAYAAYAVVGEEDVAKDGSAFSGLDIEGLKTALARVTT